MDKEQEKTAAQFRALGESIRAGLAKQRTVNPKHLASARAIIAKRWEQEKRQSVGNAQQVVAAKSGQVESKGEHQSSEQAKKKAQEQEKKKGQDRGHSR